MTHRKDIDPITPESLAFYALALGAACKDPHNFYGHNLVGESQVFRPSLSESKEICILAKIISVFTINAISFSDKIRIL